ncbi:lipoprotein [Paenibacillus pini JCM 16418]|uniref:Lipoprotein n=1 Tax=Paenibacillus pini JCM 16418 TaxID=1236976 RepID=W7YS30_9BACL|nr:lipoprotein [Paenibacillus pini JCM 16418]
MKGLKVNSLLSIKIVLILSLLVSLLSGCGAPNIKDTYPLESVNRDGNATSYVYRAANKTVPEVAQELENANTPDQISKVDNERMFLVYSKEWYHLQKDQAKPTDTLIEIDSQEYVQRNYDSSFLKGYITATIIGHLFDSLGGGVGKYRGYSSRDVYQLSKEPINNQLQLIRKSHHR